MLRWGGGGSSLEPTVQQNFTKIVIAGFEIIVVLCIFLMGQLLQNFEFQKMKKKCPEM